MDSYVSFGCSVIGPGHIKSGKPNQDSFLLKKYKNGWVAVVSDGVGSKPLSHIGSAAVCRSVCNVMRDYLNSSKSADIKDVLRLVHSRWLFDISPNLADDCCATVLFAVVTAEKIILGRLGDGMICCRNNHEDTLLLDDKTDSFSNVTKCMRYKFIYDDWYVKEIPVHDFEYVVLTTDGISDDIPSNMLPSFVKDFVNEYSIEKTGIRTKKVKQMMIDWPVPMHSDDKTIACLVNRGDKQID